MGNFGLHLGVLDFECLLLYVSWVHIDIDEQAWNAAFDGIMTKFSQLCAQLHIEKMLCS